MAANYKFRLYIAGNSENSLRAAANLDALCSRHLPDRHQIEIVDVFKEPKRALDDGVFMTPTLVKLSPKPLRKIVGSLNDAPKLLQTIGLKDND